MKKFIYEFTQEELTNEDFEKGECGKCPLGADVYCVIGHSPEDCPLMEVEN